VSQIHKQDDNSLQTNDYPHLNSVAPQHQGTSAFVLKKVKQYPAPHLWCRPHYQRHLVPQAHKARFQHVRPCHSGTHVEAVLHPVGNTRDAAAQATSGLVLKGSSLYTELVLKHSTCEVPCCSTRINHTWKRHTKMGTSGLEHNFVRETST
jgi:hypothetical protein